MFEGSKELYEGIYLYENFLSNEENLEMLNLVKSVEQDSWKRVGNAENSIFVLITPIVEPLRLKVTDICPEGLDVVYNSVVNKLTEGVTYGEHKDTNNSQEMLELSKQYKEGDDFVIGDYPTFGVVYYFNDDYKDGEIFYPEIGIKHKPKPGDLVVHKADILHGTEPPIAGTRYSYTAAFTKKIKMKK